MSLLSLSQLSPGQRENSNKLGQVRCPSSAVSLCDEATNQDLFLPHGAIDSNTIAPQLGQDVGSLDLTPPTVF